MFSHIFLTILGWQGVPKLHITFSADFQANQASPLAQHQSAAWFFFNATYETIREVAEMQEFLIFIHFNLHQERFWKIACKKKFAFFPLWLSCLGLPNLSGPDSKALQNIFSFIFLDRNERLIWKSLGVLLLINNVSTDVNLSDRLTLIKKEKLLISKNHSNKMSPPFQCK